MDDELLASAISECRDNMQKAVAHTQTEFGVVRTGRASAALVDRIRVDYYGAETPLQQIASMSVPEARLLVISPYDKGSMGAIEKAIQASDLGVNPTNDGNVIRLNFPQLTEERRKEFVKIVKQKAEDGRVAVRNARRATRQDLEAFEKAGDMSTDELKRAEEDLDKITKEYVGEIDRLFQQKEKELLEV